MTKDNWIKAFDDRFNSFPDSYYDFVVWIKRIEEEHEKQLSNATEKTNNRWRKTEIDLLFYFLVYLLERHIHEGKYFGSKDQHYKIVQELKTKLSSLLEDK